MFRTLVLISLAAAATSSLMLGADHTIVQKERAFSESDIKIRPGDKIIFKNSDEVTHNVFSVTPGMEFDLRRQAPGASSAVPFEKEGTAEVRCSIHPKIKLLVHVGR